MSLSYRARRRWALVVLVVGLPAYIVTAVTLMTWLGRPPFWLELAIYVVLGVVWALPLRFLFRGIGKDAPEDGR
jgi:Protein of unknown function (DUF2842)